MNKTELVTNIATKTGLTKKDAEASLNAFIESVEEALVSEEKVQLVGFGTFEVRQRAARQGRNPQTGEVMDIPAKKVVKFKAGKKLKDLIN